MEYRQLKYFIAAAEELSIGRAAQRLHISQPPLTRQIQQLERELGAQLFVRTPRGITLTQAGELLFRDAYNIRSLWDQAIKRAYEAGQGKLGKMDIGIFGSGILEVIPKLLQSFRAKYPDVRVNLYQMSKKEQIEALQQRRIIAAFNRMLAPQPNISSELVINEKIVVAVNADHPLARKSAIKLTDLKEQPMILFPHGSRPSFIDKTWALCASRGFEPTVSQEVEDATTSIALVAGGFGITLVAESATSLSLPGVVYRPLDGEPGATVDLSCIFRSDEDSPILSAFLNEIREFRRRAESL